MEHCVKRRSAEWVKIRQSILLTASQFADAVGVGTKPFDLFQSLVKGESSKNNEKETLRKQQMRTVVQEAYELLTGLRVQESGFWIPEEDNPLHDMIGASPDGIVISDVDPSSVFGLAKFEFSSNEVCEKMAETSSGISRPLMVQVQGQMAVCGAPWCDVMIVCGKKREVLLKRIFFQPSYWQYISSCLKHFCYALQEAEMMQELGRGVYSGAMTKRIQGLPVQHRLFPGEDSITVRTLLTQPAPHMFRGPSHKLLSYHILIGDSYDLPSALNHYGQDLLAKVDAELHLKASKMGKRRSFTLEEEEGQIRHRVFSGVLMESLDHPVFKDGDGDMFDSRGTEMTQDMDVSEPSEIETSINTDSPVTQSAVSNSHGETQDRQTTGPGAHPKSNVSTQMALSSSSATTLNKPQTDSLPVHKLSRINTNPKSVKSRLVPGQTVVSSESGKSPGPSFPKNNPGPAGHFPCASRNTPPVQVSKLSPRAQLPRSSSVGRLSGTAANLADPTSSRETSGVVSQSAVLTASSSTVSSSSAPLKTSKGLAMDLSVAKVSSSPSLQPVRRSALSAKDEWEISSMKKQSSGRVASVVTDTAAIVPTKNQSLSSQVTSSSSAVDRVTPLQRDGKTEDKGTGGWNMQGKAEMSSRESTFVPPGLTLLTEGTDSSEESPRRETSTADSNPAPNFPKSQEPSVGQQQEPRQAKKRPLMSHSQVAEVQSKKPLIYNRDSANDSGRQKVTSLERNSIHRPWQSLQKGSELHPRMEQVSDRGRDLYHRDNPLPLEQMLRERTLLDTGGERRLEGTGHRAHPHQERSGSRIPSLLETDRPGGLPRVYDYDHRDRVVAEAFTPTTMIGPNSMRGNPSSFDSFGRLPLDLSERSARQDTFGRDPFPANRSHIHGRESSLRLDRLGAESGLWREQFQRPGAQQIRPQAAWQHLQSQPDRQGLGTAVRSHWPRDQAAHLEARRAMELQPQLRDHHFQNQEGREPRLRGTGNEYRGDAIQGQFPRNFSRRPFNF